MTRPLFSRLPLIAFAALPLTAGLVLGQSGPVATLASLGSPSGAQAGAQSAAPSEKVPSAKAPATPSQSGTNYAQVYAQKLAAQLGVTPERLRAAALAAGTATLEQGVKAGDFTAEQAAHLREHLQTDPTGFSIPRFGRGMAGAGERGPGHRGGGRGHHGQAAGSEASGS